ncbi:MAG: PKD domain-containing protein, partial [Psychroflexus sp.]
MLINNNKFIATLSLIFISCFSLAQEFNISDGQTTQVCGGDNFYDTGGADATYSNNQNITHTICPENDGDFLYISFQEFNLGDGDSLSIYDSDTVDEDALIGEFDNTSDFSEISFVASTIDNDSGCLTFVFVSDGSGLGDGWESEVYCNDSCSNITPEVISDAVNINGQQTLSLQQGSNFELFSGQGQEFSNISWTVDGTEVSDTSVYSTNLSGYGSSENYSITISGTNEFGCDFEISETYALDDIIILDENGLSNTCDALFFDSGGPENNYSSDENFTYTICPDEDDKRISVSFSEFQTPGGTDFLTIYDGNDPNNDPEIVTLTGGEVGENDDPLVFVASDGNFDGCLTFVFTSNNFFEVAGWEAEIGCEDPCQFIEAEIDDVTPSDFANDTYITYFGDSLTFTAGGSFSDGNSAGATYEWDFGDGNTATGETVTHTYANLGVFQVNLTITDVNGCESENVLDQDVEVIFDAQSPSTGCPYVTTTSPILECVDPDIPQTATLTADFLETGETDTYRIESIPFAPPFPFTGLSNPISVNTDDVWSPNISLPFDFCFFGEVQTDIKVGSNGVISFQNPSGTNGWSLDQGDAIPNNSNNTISEGNIMMTHDINPNVSSSNPEIAWEILGDYPCRTFVVSYHDVTHFGASCGNNTTTFMMVLYETTNAIDFYIEDKPTCTSWNDGLVALGIQNDAGTTGFSPPGRNIGDWSASNEAWRFIPDGDPNYEFTWTGPAGTFTDQTITVPAEDGDTYTAEVIYTNCNGDEIIETSSETLEVSYAFQIETEDEVELCPGDSEIIEVEIVPADEHDLELSDLTFEWFQDGELIEGETGSSISVSEEGTYVVIADDGECESNASTNVIESEIHDEINPDDIELCYEWDSGDTVDLTSVEANVYDGLDPDDYAISYYLTESDALNGQNPIMTPSAYLPSNEVETIFVRLDDLEIEECFVVGSFDLILYISAINEELDKLTTCTDPGEEFTEFDLTQNTDPALDHPELESSDYTFTVAYFETQLDAEDNSNAIANPEAYTNTSNPQTIWVNVINDDNTDCFSTSSFEIEAFPTPEVQNTIDLDQCGDFTFTQSFDLTQNDTEVYGDQEQDDFSISYYTTETAAENANNVIQTPENYVPSNDEESIYVRIENNDNPDCYSIGSFEVILYNIEIGDPEDIELCDDGSGNTEFDLTMQDNDVLASQSAVTHAVTYYTEENDAIDGVNAIEAPNAYMNIDNPETIWVRVENLASVAAAET